MPIATDVSVASNGNIRYTGTVANYSVIELHRFLQGLADDALAAGDDLLDITNSTPSDRSTDNIITLLAPYNIDDTLAQHLYDGSIIQAGGDTIYDGFVVYANAGAYVSMIQNGAVVTPNFWTTGLNADAGQGISHRFMLKTRTAGADIDGRRLIGQTREFGFSYSEFKVAGTSRGNNTVALVYAADLNNQTVVGTVAGWNTITNTEGFRALDVDNNTVNENYYSEWNRATFTINQFYERTKWLSRRGSGSTIYGLNGELFRGITHEITVDAPTGTFAAVETVTWTGGTGKMLAINSPTAATKMWIQLLTGVAPVDNQVITGVSAATATVNVTVIERTLSFPFIGQSTGSSIIGAYGVGLETADLSASDKLFDLTNTQRTPPNNVTFTVNGLVIGEDYLLVGPEAASTFNAAQLALNTTLSGAAETAVVMTAPIPTDTPATGTIRIELNTGIYRKIAYTSYTGSTFTIAATSFAGANQATAGNDVWISYIDKLATATSESFSGVFLSTRSLYIRARDGGGTPIKTFETTGSLGAAGGSTTIIRTSDA